ncbi:hypothetical protein BX070DRAFT_221186 [Coemansia spiralis]|nr:hypothetical protein BX070DRAFT_221186 [Coemansia spiralis]
MRGQAQASTLKAFVRVSKNSDAPAGKGGGKQVAPRMATRSRSATLAIEEKKQADETGMKSTRKRKVALEEPDTETNGPAKRTTRTINASQRRGATADPEPKPVRRNNAAKKLTTINAYFPSSPSATAKKSSSKSQATMLSHERNVTLLCDAIALSQSAVVTEKSSSPLITAADSPTMAPVGSTEAQTQTTDAASSSKSLPTIVDKITCEAGDDMNNAVEESTSEQALLAEGSGTNEKKVARRAKTNALLDRLRNRKRPDNGDESSLAVEEHLLPASSNSNETAVLVPKIDVTRAIQDTIRERREQARVAESPAESAKAQDQTASFGISKISTAEDIRTRELKRQFVLINSRAGGTAPLSRELRKLEELFQGLEHVILFGGQGASGVVYHKIRKSVESIAKRTFGWKELGQLLAIYPESYKYKPLTATHEGRRTASVVLIPVAHGLNLAVEMEARREEFRRRLVSRVADAHDEFLADRGYTKSDMEMTSGWHPMFDIESTRPVTPIALPPVPTPMTCSSGQQPDNNGVVSKFDKNKLKHLLAKHSDTSSAGASSSTSAGASSADSSKEAEKTDSDDNTLLQALPTPTDSPVLQPSKAVASGKAKQLASGAKGLLERIREKQRAKEAAQLLSAAVIPASMRSMYSRLPGILEAISFLYYTERKNTLSFYYVVEKISDSKGLDQPDTVSHIVKLTKFVPEWCAIVDDDSADTNAKQDPSPNARLKIIRAISMQEAKAKLASSISSLQQ